MTGYSWSGRFNDALADGNIAVLPKPVDIGAILDRLDKAQTKSALVMIDNDPDPTLFHQLSEKGYDLAATARPTAALMLTERWRLVLLSRTLPYLRQSELALLDPGDAKCAALLISEQAQPDLNSLVPAALTKPFKIDRLIDLLEGIRLRDASQ
jgi:hypothetical protein